MTQPFHTLLLSPDLIDELARVLRYDRLRPVHGLSDAEIDQFVADLVLVGDLVATPAAVGPISMDPDDDPVIAAAVLGHADVLCTLDRHLHQAVVKDYCAAHGVEVVTDLQLIARLRAAALP